MTADAIRFWYKNYRGEVSNRCVKPISVRYGSSQWHPRPQWLMTADELDDTYSPVKRREFAMNDMSEVDHRPTMLISTIVCEP